jgi:tellurite resistance protein TehA-like permease
MDSTSQTTQQDDSNKMSWCQILGIVVGIVLLIVIIFFSIGYIRKKISKNDLNMFKKSIGDTFKSNRF